MYYHPFVLPAPTTERGARIHRAIADIWLTGIERQRAVQTRAAREFYAACLEDARRLSESRDAEHLAARMFSFAAFDPLRLIAVASELGDIAADTHRQAMQLLELHGEGLAMDAPIDAEQPGRVRGRTGNRGSKSGKLQMMA